MRLAIDIDGTINGDPAFFSPVCRNLLRSGEVHIVSSRSPAGRVETVAELAGLGIEYSALHLIDTISAAQSLCPQKQLDWFQRHQWLKVDYALAHRITHFVDDDSKGLALIARFAPSIAAIAFEDRAVLLQHALAEGVRS